jgi:hypothetical protein
MSTSHTLIHLRCRSAFREACVGWAVVRQIERAFEDEGFDAADEDEAPSAAGWYAPGARRSTFDRCTHAVDWADRRDVRRVLNVFEQVLA